MIRAKIMNLINHNDVKGKGNGKKTDMMNWKIMVNFMMIKIMIRGITVVVMRISTITMLIIQVYKFTYFTDRDIYIILKLNFLKFINVKNKRIKRLQ